MNEAKVIGGDTPLIIVAYSLGGIVARQIVVDHLEANRNLKGILFLASPLHGSEMERQIMRDLSPFVTMLRPYFDHFNAISEQEQIHHFRYEGFSVSRISDDINETHDKGFHTRTNRRLMDM